MATAYDAGTVSLTISGWLGAPAANFKPGSPSVALSALLAGAGAIPQPWVWKGSWAMSSKFANAGGWSHSAAATTVQNLPAQYRVDGLAFETVGMDDEDPISAGGWYLGDGAWVTSTTDTTAAAFKTAKSITKLCRPNVAYRLAGAFPDDGKQIFD